MNCCWILLLLLCCGGNSQRNCGCQNSCIEPRVWNDEQDCRKNKETDSRWTPYMNNHSNCEQDNRNECGCKN